MRTERWIWRCLALHLRCAGIGDKRLGLGVEGMAIITAGDGMLALRVVGVHIDGKLSVLVWDSWRTRALWAAHMAGVQGCSRGCGLRWIGSGWRWVEGGRLGLGLGLPATLGSWSRKR